MNIEISNNEKTKNKTIYTELSPDNFKNLLNDDTSKQNNTVIIIKLGATWCAPCQKIKEQCSEQFLQMPENVLCFDIDVDDNFELFGALKTKKMVKGIPALLGYYCNKERDYWFIPDKSISGSDSNKINDFFKNFKN